MILLSHPTGNENVRQVLQAFSEADLLGEFWTALNWKSDSAWDFFLPEKIRQTVRRRSFPTLSGRQIRTVPWREIARLLTASSPLRGFARHEMGPFSVDRVWRDLDSRVARRLGNLSNVRLVYAYEDAALETFRVAAEQHVRRVYDLPIGYWKAGRKIFLEERERQPAWASTLIGAQDSDEKLARKEAELQLADRVVVASSYTKFTLEATDAKSHVEVISYGAPPVCEKRPERVRCRRGHGCR